MTTGKKSTRTLELEADCPRQESPFRKYFEPIINPKAQMERSKTALGLKAQTVAEALPELSIIARENHLDLNTAKGWKEGVRILNANNLNK